MRGPSFYGSLHYTLADRGPEVRVYRHAENDVLQEYVELRFDNVTLYLKVPQLMDLTDTLRRLTDEVLTPKDYDLDPAYEAFMADNFGEVA